MVASASPLFSHLVVPGRRLTARSQVGGEGYLHGLAQGFPPFPLLLSRVSESGPLALHFARQPNPPWEGNFERRWWLELKTEFGAWAAASCGTTRLYV